MAAEAFINFFEKLPKDVKLIKLQDFFKSYFSVTTPIKMKINYSDNINNCIKEARNCIIRNWSINPFFLIEDGFEREMVQSICELLVSTKEQADDNQIAQIIFLLHLSKSNLDCKNIPFFYSFYGNIKTIKLQTSIKLQINENEVTLNDFSCLFSMLSKSKIIQNLVNKVVKNICTREPNFDYNSCKLAYFNSDLVELNGFAGINQIYVSSSEIKRLYSSIVNIYLAQS